jgi:hypothetical protein
MKNTLVLTSIVGMALVTSATQAMTPAQIITESGALSGNPILASQLTDLGPGAQDNNRDYANNQGPAGQTFQVASAGTAYSVSVKGRGDSASAWTTGPQPFNGTEVWALQLGSVNGNGSINVLDTESYTGFVAGVNIADYLTFNLANPQALTPGVTYEWTISIDAPGHNPWIGWAHSSTDVLTSPGIGSYAMDNNTSMANPGGANGGATPVMGGFAAPIPANYDYVFAVQGVPEPATVALLGLGGLALVAFRRRA